MADRTAFLQESAPSAAPVGSSAVGLDTPTGRPPTLQWCDLRFTVPGGQEILKGVSGQLKPGELSSILGPSGAGKTTLLNVLAGRQRTSGGGYQLNGNIEFGDQVLQPEEIKRRVAYVMQDDTLLPTQTVREALLFSAAMKLPGSSREEREGKVERLLTSLGLERCADTGIGSSLVKGISGGERKRTSVGVELITNPSVVFLDEPTSGLDSFAAFQLVKLLLQLAARGRIVCCTIHQPSSDTFELFDRVTCLRRGSVLFQGPNKNLLKELSDNGIPCPAGYNVADWLLCIAQTREDTPAMEDLNDAVGDLRRKTSVSSSPRAAEQEATMPAEVRRTAFCRQLALLTRREALNVWRDKKSFGARMGTTLGQAILYALIFPGVADSEEKLAKMAADSPVYEAYGNISSSLGSEFGALVGLSIAAFFGASQPLLLSFPLERPVFLREYSSNMYSVSAYFLSKTAVEVTVTLVQNLALFLITYWVLGLRGNFFELVLATWLMAISSASMALWIGCTVSTPSSAVQLAPAISVPQILFSGLFVKSDQLPGYLRWVQYGCSLKYAINLLCISEYGDLSVPVPGAAAYEGTSFLKGQDINKDDSWIYIVVLLAIFVGFRLLAVFALKSKAKYVF